MAATLDKISALLCAAALASGCSTTVNLTLKNVEPFSQNVTVLVQKDDWEVEKTIPVGTVEGNTRRDVTPFKVHNGAQFVVESEVPGSGSLFARSTKVYGDEDPLPVTMELRHQAGTVLEDEQPAARVIAAFRTVAPDAGSYPTDLGAALRLKLNTLVILQEEEGATKEIFSLSPEQFGIAALAEVLPAAAREAGEVAISGADLAAAAAASPFCRFLGIGRGSSEVYKVKWQFEGFGLCGGAGTEGAEVAAGFERLPDEVKAQIKDILELNRNAKLYYVSKGYLVSKARVTFEKGVKVPPGTKVGPGDVITASGIYRFGSGGVLEKEYEDLVLNFYAEEVALALVPKGAQVTMSFDTASGPLFTNAVAFEIVALPTGKGRTVLPEHLNAPPAKQLSAPR